MPEYIAFYLIFSSQILLISYYFPRKMLNRMRYVIDKYPPSTHPKLYPVSIDTVEKGLSTYRMMNRFILLAGVALVLNGVYSPSDEMLNWDSQSVLLFYFMLQYSPLLVLGRFGVKYLSLMRKANSRTTRSAELHPRRLFDFVSHRLVYVAISTYIVCILIILYVSQDSFPGFVGYWNILWVTALNLFFVVTVAWIIYGKKRDPHQAREDRLREMELAVKILVRSSILATVFMSIAFILPALELRNLTDIATMLFFQLCAVVGFPSVRIDDTNFDVYKKDPLVA